MLFCILAPSHQSPNHRHFFLLVISKGILFPQTQYISPNLHAMSPKICFISVSLKLGNDITNHWVLQTASVNIVIVVAIFNCY